MSVLNDARKLIEGRLEELEQERQKLERALKELDGDGRRRGGRPKGSRSAGRTKARTAVKPVAPKRRRGRGAGGRADQAVALVEKSPGITAGEIAKKLRIKPNYLYRVLGQLEKEGRVKKQGRRYTAA